MSRRRRRHRVPPTTLPSKRLTAHVARSLPRTASPAAALGAELRASAEVNECCICGAEPEWFAVESYDPPALRRLDGPLPDGTSHAVYVHRRDCPAGSPQVEAALTH